MSSCDYRDRVGRCFGRGEVQFGDVYCQAHAHIGEAADKARADLERRTVDLLEQITADRDANIESHCIDESCCTSCDAADLLAEWKAVRS